MRYWLSRLSFSFLVLGLVLVYSGHGAQGEGGVRREVVWYYIGAAACFAAGLAGIRERHRRDA